MTATILVVNAGSSSIKFQLFSIGAGDQLQRRLKGQIEGIGVRPHLAAKGVEAEVLIDKTWPAAEVGDVLAALGKVVEFLHAEIGTLPIAVGHRVVHGGPDHSAPILDAAVVERLQAFAHARLFISRTISGRSALCYNGNRSFRRLPAHRRCRREFADHPRSGGERLDWIGLELDPAGNAKREGRISARGSRIACYVILTDEELMIARHTLSVLRAQAAPCSRTSTHDRHFRQCRCTIPPASVASSLSCLRRKAACKSYARV